MALQLISVSNEYRCKSLMLNSAIVLVFVLGFFDVLHAPLETGQGQMGCCLGLIAPLQVLRS